MLWGGTVMRSQASEHILLEYDVRDMPDRERARVTHAMRAERLRDEMREHFRLKEAGVLSQEQYEASKARILGQHAPRAGAPAHRA